MQPQVGPCIKEEYCYRNDEAIAMCDFTYYYRGKSEYNATKLVDIKKATRLVDTMNSKLWTKQRQRWLCCKFPVALKA